MSGRLDLQTWLYAVTSCPKIEKVETPDSIRFPGRTSQAKAAPAKAAETSFEEVGLLGDKLLIGASPPNCFSASENGWNWIFWCALNQDSFPRKALFSAIEQD